MCFYLHTSFFINGCFRIFYLCIPKKCCTFAGCNEKRRYLRTVIRFQSWCEKEALFDWSPDTSEEPGSDLITWEPDNNNQRKITYWK